MFPYGVAKMESDVYFVSPSQVNIRQDIIWRALLSVYLSASNMLVWLSSACGLNVARNMKGLSLLVITLIITECAVLYIYSWYFNHYTVCSTVYLQLVL